MTDNIQKDGTCGLCDKTARTRLVKGEFCCPNCHSIRLNAKNHAPLMLAQILEFHPELLGLHPPSQAASAPVMTPAAACELAEAGTELDNRDELIRKQARAIVELQERTAADASVYHRMRQIMELSEGDDMLAAGVELMAELGNLREAASAGEDRQPLNGELAAANINLVKKLRDMEQVNALLGDEAKFHADEILRLKGLGLELSNILFVAPGAALTDTARQLMNELQSLRVEMAELSKSGPQALNEEFAATDINLVQKLLEMEERNKSLQLEVEGLMIVIGEHDSLRPPVLAHEKTLLQEENLHLRGELEGLQDVLTSQEEERSNLLRERDQQVRYLQEELVTAKRAATGMEREIDRLQECKTCVLDTTTYGGPAGKALPLIEEHAGQSTPDLHLLIDADDNSANMIDRVGPVPPCVPGYESLTAVLSAALDQASVGKGVERHAKAGEPFDRQKICEITRRVGLAFPLGQAIKKAEESIRLGDRGPYEILGAINYLAAAHICMSEQVEAGRGSEAE